MKLRMKNSCKIAEAWLTTDVTMATFVYAVNSDQIRLKIDLDFTSPLD